MFGKRLYKFHRTGRSVPRTLDPAEIDAFMFLGILLAVFGLTGIDLERKLAYR